MFGAQERTRTSTPLRELAPEASASANSATWAKDLANNYHHAILPAPATTGQPRRQRAANFMTGARRQRCETAFIQGVANCLFLHSSYPNECVTYGIKWRQAPCRTST